MKKWSFVLAAGILGGCASGADVIYLTDGSSQQVTCGPFSTKTPIKRYLEAEFGAPGSAERLGDTAETQLRDCVENYRRQGYALLGAPTFSAVAPIAPAARVAPVTPAAPVTPDRARPIYDAAVAAERGDSTTALQSMRRLAEQGDINAQTVLGKAYKDGLGVLQDYVQAHKWYNLAAANAATSGPEKELRDVAFGEREALTQLMSREQIAEAQKLAREWRPDSAN
jgi:hypothetical protein